MQMIAQWTLFTPAGSGLSRENAEQCRNKLVSSVEASLDNVSSWGEGNLVQFNPLKTQVCALPSKDTSLRGNRITILSKHSRYSRAQYQYIGS